MIAVRLACLFFSVGDVDKETDTSVQGHTFFLHGTVAGSVMHTILIQIL